MKLKVRYDPDVDVLYIAKEGEEQEAIEVYPDVGSFTPEKESVTPLTADRTGCRCGSNRVDVILPNARSQSR